MQSPLETAERSGPSTHNLLANAVLSLWPLVLLRGILLIVLGAYALASPGMTLVVFTQVLGIFAFADGVLAVVTGVMGWTDSRSWMIVRGILGIVVGLFVIGHAPIIGAIAATVVMIIIAAQAVVVGILEIVAAIRHRKQISGEGWLILGGILSIILGALLFASPLLSSLVLIRIIGVFAIFAGISLLVTAFRIRRIGKILSAGGR